VTAALLAPPSLIVPPPREILELEQLRADDAKRARARPSDGYIDGVPKLPDERKMQLQFHSSTHIIRAMFPGNGAGKTTTMGVECDWWLQKDHPHFVIPSWRIVVIWFTLKYQQFDVLREQLERKCLSRGWAWNSQKHKYTWPNGSQMFIFSADADWAAAQGINPDLICFDENPPVKIWREMQMRRRGDKQTRFCIAATATKGLTWMFTDVYKPWLEAHKKLGLTEDQAMVRQLHPTIFCWPKGGLEDNPAASEVDKDWYNNQVRYGSDAERIVRTGGGFQDLNSKPVFNQTALLKMKPEVMDPPPPSGTLKQVADERVRFKPGDPVEFQWLPSNMPWRGGRLTVYELPREDCEYGIGSDTAWGLETSDYSTFSVGRRTKDPKTGRIHVHQVAEGEGRWDASALSWLLWAFGWFYNEALVAVERNNGGLEVCRRLYDDRNYCRQYFEEKDEEKNVKHTDKLGYTKHDDRIITRVQYFIGPFDDAGNALPHQLHVRSEVMWQQMQQYQFRPRSKAIEIDAAKDDDLIMGAPDGQFDDLVIAGAAMILACLNLPQIPKTRPNYKRGSLADVLGHADVYDPQPKAKGAFSRGGRR
jgi:hypothetical protein